MSGKIPAAIGRLSVGGLRPFGKAHTPIGRSAEAFVATHDGSTINALLGFLLLVRQHINEMHFDFGVGTFRLRHQCCTALHHQSCLGLYEKQAEVFQDGRLAI